MAVVVALVVFAKARAFRHALCFPSLPPFPLFAVARVNFEEEEEEEEASDDDLIGTLDPVKKSAIFYSHLLMISLSLCSLFFSLFESAASLEKRTVLLVVVTLLPLVEGEYYYSKRKRKRKRERKEERVEM